MGRALVSGLLEEAGLRVLAGRGLSVRQQAAGLVALASDIDEEAGAAAVWLLRHAGAGPTQHLLQYERGDGWQYLGEASTSARELSLASRPSAVAGGSMLAPLISGAARSRRDRERAGAGLGVLGAGWVAAAGFRATAEVSELRVGQRPVTVPEHGYAVVAWKSPAALARPWIAAVSADGSRLTEFAPEDRLDARAWEDIEAALRDTPPS
jgi:hypothetical protein